MCTACLIRAKLCVNIVPQVLVHKCPIIAWIIYMLEKSIYELKKNICGLERLFMAKKRLFMALRLFLQNSELIFDLTMHL